MTYFYRVGYSDYEDGDAVVLAHSEKFDHQAFIRMVGEAAHYAAAERLKDTVKDIVDGGYTYTEGLLSFSTQSRFVDLYERTASRMVVLFGFERIQYADKFNCWSRYDLSDCPKPVKYADPMKPDERSVADAVSLGLSCPLVPSRLIGTHDEMLVAMRRPLIEPGQIIANAKTHELERLSNSEPTV